MYIKQLSAVHMGPISEVSIIFPFLESGNPKPLIIVGENGTGKTTLLSNVVDSLYELAGKAFHDVTESDGGSGHQYFKAISPSEIQIGQNYMYSVVEYTSPRNAEYSVGYVLKSGTVSADQVKSSNSFCANKKVSWNDKDNYKVAFIKKEESETIFGRSVFCYFALIGMKSQHGWERNIINKMRICTLLLRRGGVVNYENQLQLGMLMTRLCSGY